MLEGGTYSVWCFGEGFGSWGWFGGIGMIIFWILLLSLAVWLVTRLLRNDRAQHTAIALDIVRERYAKGEISKDEYDQYRKTL